MWQERYLAMVAGSVKKTRYYLTMTIKDEEYSDEDLTYFYQTQNGEIAGELAGLFNRKFGRRPEREKDVPEEKPELHEDAPGCSTQVAGSPQFSEVSFAARSSDELSVEDQVLIEERIEKVAKGSRFWDGMSSSGIHGNYHDGSEDELSPVNLYHQAEKWEEALIRKEHEGEDESTEEPNVEFPLVVHIRSKEKPEAAEPEPGGEEHATPAVPVSQGEPPKPIHWLLNWREILDALEWKNDEEGRRQIARLNKVHHGPIISTGRGGQPKVGKAELIEWWNRLRDKFEAIEKKNSDAQLTVEDRYDYSRDGEVFPEISGHIKRRRKDRKP
jgi:hypothetical protein